MRHRGYAFDRSSNRTNRTTVSDDCDPATADSVTATENHTYDAADRITDAGYAYDAYGRTTTLPRGTQLSYYANDLVRGETLGDTRKTWDLDSAGRLATATTETKGEDGTWTITARSTNHYDGPDDKPTWSREVNGKLTRNVTDLGGQLVAATGTDGGAILVLTNLHGDASVQMSPDGTQDLAVYHYDEYGNVVDATGTTEYGWHGGQLRAGDSLSGLVLMGVRVYDPTTGRFLQTDPVLKGSPNAYGYPVDPITMDDLDGLRWLKSWTAKLSKASAARLAKKMKKAGSISSIIGLIVGLFPHYAAKIIGGILKVLGFLLKNFGKAVEQANNRRGSRG